MTEVELDIFSGRPNPRWSLEAGPAEQFHRILSGLTATDMAAARPLGLGYRGFRGSAGGVSWQVYAGSVIIGGVVFADPRRRVERWLLDTIPDRLASLRSVIAAELDTPSGPD